MVNKEVEASLLTLNNIYNGLTQEDPYAVNFKEVESIVDEQINVFERNNSLSLMIDYFLRCMQRLDETARLISDYKTAMHFRRRKIVFEERLLQKRRGDGQKDLAELMASIGNGYIDFGGFMFKEKIENTAAYMLSFVAFETAYTYASTDVKRHKGSMKLVHSIVIPFEISAYRLVCAQNHIERDHSEPLEFIIGKENQDIIELRKPQILKLSTNINHIYDRWHGLKKAARNVY